MKNMRLYSTLSCLTIAGLLMLPDFCGRVCAADDDLPPEVLMDQYLQQAQTAYKAEKWKDAAEQYGKALALKTAAPVDAHYEYAVCLKNCWCDPSSSIVELKNYLKAAGRDEKHYQDALALLTQAQADAKAWNQARKYSTINQAFFNEVFFTSGFPDSVVLGAFHRHSKTSDDHAEKDICNFFKTSCGRICIRVDDSPNGLDGQGETKQEITFYPNQIERFEWAEASDDNNQILRNGAYVDARKVTFTFKEPLCETIKRTGSGQQTVKSISEISIYMNYGIRFPDGRDDGDDNIRALSNKLKNALRDLIAKVKAADAAEATGSQKQKTHFRQIMKQEQTRTSKYHENETHTLLGLAACSLALIGGTMKVCNAEIFRQPLQLALPVGISEAGLDDYATTNLITALEKTIDPRIVPLFTKISLQPYTVALMQTD